MAEPLAGFDGYAYQQWPNQSCYLRHPNMFETLKMFLNHPINSIYKMPFFTTGDPRWWSSEPCLHPVPLRALFYLPSRLVLWHCSTWNLHRKRHVGWSQLCALSLHRFRKFSHATDPTCNMSCMNSVWSFYVLHQYQQVCEMCTKTMAPPHSSIYHTQKHLQGQRKMFDGAFFGLTALQTNMAMENTLPRKRTRKPLPPMPARTLHDCWVKSCGKSPTYWW